MVMSWYNGIYSLVSTPFTQATSLCGRARALLSEHQFCFDIYFGLLALLREIMLRQEQYLRRKFGEAYDNWSDSVRAVIPRLKGL